MRPPHQLSIPRACWPGSAPRPRVPRARRSRASTPHMGGMLCCQAPKEPPAGRYTWAKPTASELRNLLDLATQDCETLDIAHEERLFAAVSRAAGDMDVDNFALCCNDRLQCAKSRQSVELLLKTLKIMKALIENEQKKHGPNPLSSWQGLNAALLSKCGKTLQDLRDFDAEPHPEHGRLGPGEVVTLAHGLLGKLEYEKRNSVDPDDPELEPAVEPQTRKRSVSHGSPPEDVPPQPEPLSPPDGAAAAARGADNKRPHPQEAGAKSAALTGGYVTCLDRFFVQKELRWAKQYGKQVIVVFEAEERRASHFDHGKAMATYKGTEWEYILNIDGIPYRRDEDEAELMVTKIMRKADGPQATVAAENPCNPPGVWDFFLSHAQATGGDQTQTTQLRLKAKGKSVWYDHAMQDRSTAAMEEGVRCCGCVVLFLTGTSSEDKEQAERRTKLRNHLKDDIGINSGLDGLLDDLTSHGYDDVQGFEMASLEQLEEAGLRGGHINRVKSFRERTDPLSQRSGTATTGRSSIAGDGNALTPGVDSRPEEWKLAANTIG